MTIEATPKDDAAMTPEDLLAPTYTQMLGALSAWLGKAAGQFSDTADDLLAARLAPDMFPLATQVRFACVQALEGMHRLKGADLPDAVNILLEEGREAGDRPGRIADAQRRIAETLQTVASMACQTGETDPQRPLAHALPNGMVFDFTAATYARDWAIGQFYFHVMTAYAILRHRGVALGKADYVGHLLPLVRPEALPQN